MKSIIPTGAWLWLWRIHFAALVMLFIATLLAAISLPGDSSLPIQFDLFSLLILLLGAILVGGSIAGESGYLFQRSMSTQGFWRALFVIMAIFWAVGIVLTFVVSFYMAPVGASFLDVREWLEILISAGNLWAIWAYAYRSPHLWNKPMTVEHASL